MHSVPAAPGSDRPIMKLALGAPLGGGWGRCLLDFDHTPVTAAGCLDRARAPVGAVPVAFAATSHTLRNSVICRQPSPRRSQSRGSQGAAQVVVES